LDDEIEREPGSGAVLTMQELAEKYDGTRLTGVRKPSYERLADQEICPAEYDQYICPQGQILLLSSRRKGEQVYVYTAEASMCNDCPVKTECTESKSGRHIFRSFFQEDLDRARAYQETEDYQKAMRKRALWTEPLFGEAKEFHRLRRFRLRGLRKVNIEGVMVAAGQNLKRLIN
jgi:hypothetical protein